MHKMPKIGIDLFKSLGGKIWMKISHSAVFVVLKPTLRVNLLFHWVGDLSYAPLSYYERL